VYNVALTSGVFVNEKAQRALSAIRCSRWLSVLCFS